MSCAFYNLHCSSTPSSPPACCCMHFAGCHYISVAGFACLVGGVFFTGSAPLPSSSSSLHSPHKYLPLSTFSNVDVSILRIDRRLSFGLHGMLSFVSAGAFLFLQHSQALRWQQAAFRVSRNHGAYTFLTSKFAFGATDGTSCVQLQFCVPHSC